MNLKHLKEMTIINEVGVGFFQEATVYSNIDEFSDEFNDLRISVAKMKKVMKNPKWMEYLRTADRNIDLNTEPSGHDAVDALDELDNCLADIDREFDKLRRASNNRSRKASVDVDVDVEDTEEK